MLFLGPHRAGCGAIPYISRMITRFSCWLTGLLALVVLSTHAQQPNIILIYADDVGYGDLGSYGNQSIPTPHLDALAHGGLRFTQAYTTAATCTPSRYSLLTGRYNWRQQGTGIANGNAGLILDTARPTLASMLQQAGYATAMLGKWHLGLGGANGPNWNGKISPGPLECGFDYAWYLPSTNDRVPCVYIENHHVLNLEPTDPIAISYTQKIGNEPTGLENPELLTMHPSHGHNMTIINGISRIGWMTGGRAARWRDQDIADSMLVKAQAFMRRNAGKPFFMYFNPHDIHVPRTPHERFVGKSGHGLRGDALLELDWTVGELLKTIAQLGIAQNTLVIFSSDNGPVIDDGYHDQSVEQLQQHKPWGPLRGGKYSILEAGCRVPMLAIWPGRIQPGVSHALFSQIDLYSTLATLAGGRVSPGAAPDSRNALPALLGTDTVGRPHVVLNALPVQSMALRQGSWKYIRPTAGQQKKEEVNIETGLATEAQLYHLSTDPGEANNLATQYPQKVADLEALLQHIIQSNDQPNTKKP